MDSMKDAPVFGYRPAVGRIAGASGDMSHPPAIPRRWLVQAAAWGAAAAAGGWLPGRRLAAPAAALTPSRIFFEEPGYAGVRLSPRGGLLAWVAPVGSVRNLWVAPADDPGSARPVTAAERPVAPFFVWAWTERHIVFFEERGGDENWRASSVDVVTGAVVPLTPESGVRSFLQQRSRRFPTEMLLAHNGRDRRLFDLHRVDVVTGASTPVFDNPEFDRLYTDLAFELRLARRTRGDGAQEYVLRRAAEGGAGGGAWEAFDEVALGDVATTWATGLSADRRSLFMVDSRGRDRAALFEVDLETRARRLLAEDPEADVAGAALDPGTERPVAAYAIGAARRRWHLVDPAFGSHLARLEAVAAAAPGGELRVEHRSTEGGRLVAYVERDAAPGEFLLYDEAGGGVRPLFAARPGLRGVPLRPMTPATIPARDGLPLRSYLTLPADGARGGPMVLVVHGGPYARDAWGYSATHQWLASRGYAVLGVNYRGSTGFGKAFVNAADREWGGRMHDDLVDAVAWAVAEGHADPARVGIYGASFGGYAALTAATRTPALFACAVDVFGISNLETFMATVPPYWSPWFAVWKRRLADPATEEGRAWLRERSPLTHVDRIARPLLIAQGLNDVRVRAAESEQIVAAMRARGLPVTYVTFPDEGHGFARPENRRAFGAVAELFLAQHLGGGAEPVGDAFAGSSIRVEAGRDLVRGLG